MAASGGDLVVSDFPFPAGTAGVRGGVDTFDQMDGLLRMRWGQVTLSNLHSQALADPGGIRCESIRIQEGGQRLVAAVCVTGAEALARILSVVQFPPELCSKDWGEWSLLGMLSDAEDPSRLLMEAIKGESGEVTAVIFMAAGPDSMRSLERMFSLPD